MKNVRIIPAKPKENKKLKVAAYCRVSTSGPEQLRSLEIQISAYTKMIKSHSNWLFAGVFYDIESGLRRSGRKSLDKLLRRAEKGKIDFIITKSISRVSRDTLEVLKIIRFLRERGINMHFENERLDSIEADKEFEITLRGMLAQDESRNISENIQWGFQRKFEKGDTFTKYKNFMGYDCFDGEIVIVPEQAEVVRKIFDLYLQEEMAKRSRFVSNEDGTVEACGSKYNGKYILGNLLVCGDCGASYRRRTERGKVVWRCATRIEKGKEACPHSPTLDEGWLQDTLSAAVCQNGVYDESAIRNEVDKIQVWPVFIDGH